MNGTVVARSCTEVGTAGDGGARAGPSRSLDDFRETAAYVLLGAPGAGKTTAFEREAEHDGGCYVDARDFLTFDNRPEWRDVPLFIDGLDEMRAGAEDARTPIDAIRAQLERLKPPKLRLSCREADWLGIDDAKRLASVAPSGTVAVLHLDPLSGDDVLTILSAYPGVKDAEAFVRSARDHGVDALLANPQSLRMLADTVVEEGAWPATRTETFERACRMLLEECNEQHLMPNRNGCGEDALIDAAGLLCAVQLLAGKDGYWLADSGGPRDGESGYIALHRMPDDRQRLFRRALASRLFEAPSADRAIPTHRQIAEFLAARCMAERIKTGLPLGRAFAVMGASNDAIASDLRGLAAWLAAHSQPSRSAIIALDPFGAALYGDARRFSKEEKRLALERLRKWAAENPQFAPVASLGTRIEDIMTPDEDMEETLRKLLGETVRDDAQQFLVRTVCGALGHRREPLPPSLAMRMKAIFQDSSWRAGVRRAGVDALIRSCKNGNDIPALVRLLEDIEAGETPDPDYALQAHLLEALYPEALSASKLLRHLLDRPVVRTHGTRYERFWTERLAQASDPDQLRCLLDGLVERYGTVRDKPTASDRGLFFIGRILRALLRRFLETFPGDVFSNLDDAFADRLFDWYSVAAALTPDPTGAREEASWRAEALAQAGAPADLVNATRREETDAAFLHRWLKSHADAWRAVAERAVRRFITEAGGEDARGAWQRVDRCLFGAEPPDCDAWCLEQAEVEIEAGETAAVRYFADKAVRCATDARQRAGAEARLAANPALSDVFTERGGVSERAGAEAQNARAGPAEAPDPRFAAWRERVRSQAVELRENRCRPALLYSLARVYLGDVVDVPGKTPRERLRNLLADDEGLVEAVLTAFRLSIQRADVPDDAEIFRLRAQDSVHRLALPIMAGMEEGAACNVAAWDEARVRLVLAVYHTLSLSAYVDASLPGPWHKQLSESHPRWFADAVARAARAELRLGKPLSQEIRAALLSEGYEEATRSTRLALLPAFSVRCADAQLADLGDLLRAALLDCDEAALLSLVERKLSCASMLAGQRVYWLAAGALTDPGQRLARLEEYVAKNERRVRHLAAFMVGDGARPYPVRNLDVSTLRVLIQHIGKSYRPQRLITGQMHVPTQDSSVSEQLSAMIAALACSASAQATETLEALAADDDLRPWRARLEHAAAEQRARRREAEFRRCDVDQALEMLANGRPANAADLAALTVDVLDEIRKNIRCGNTSAWRQCWNVDSNGQPEHPRPENACRDTLLSELRLRMQRRNADTQAEVRHANDTRSDIRVSCDGFGVPLECKTDESPELWTALRGQLMAKYAKDPDADGRGIYAVFWFGRKLPRRPPSASGPRPQPTCPEELERFLGEELSEEEARRISVRVIDVSKPSAD